MKSGEITLSVVSHGQPELVRQLLADIDAIGADGFLKEVIITNNISRISDFTLDSIPLKIINNKSPKGFGENHNSAFKHCSSPYFCVVNPDIRTSVDPFESLLEFIEENPFGVVGPKVINLLGQVEDSARPFPIFFTLFKKLLRDKSASLYPDNNIPNLPDWVAGMFMLFDSKAFQEVGGFDERYFLYYEDADICARLRNAGWGIGYCRDAEVIHDARRDSHRKLRYLKWHVSSMIRFLTSSAYRAVKKR
jgi:N-acetylglucosaminyl-diphospho-decaprenol L-rhamnosyltransferase